MLIVAFHERGPRVAWLQIMLNRHGAKLRVDGVFGGRTRDAVHEYQRRNGLPVGQASIDTFASLVRASSDQVVDVTDIGDLGHVVIPEAMKKLGSTTIALAAMSNGIERMVREVTSRAAPGRIALLRIHGHGNLGRWMTASVGAVVHQLPDGRIATAEDYPLVAQSRSFLSADNFAALAPKIGQLAPYFAPYGSFEHTGCSLGSRGETRAMMGRLANLLGVPVSAGVSLQRHVFRFDGAVVHAFPGGATLSTWSQRFAHTSF